MKEFSNCAICEKSFWVKDLKRVMRIYSVDDDLKLPAFICKKCRKDMDGLHDPYVINMGDGPEL